MLCTGGRKSQYPPPHALMIIIPSHKCEIAFLAFHDKTPYFVMMVRVIFEYTPPNEYIVKIIVCKLQSILDNIYIN